MVFSQEDKFLTKNYDNCKVTLLSATRFLRQFRTKNWTRAQILTIILKRTVIQTYNSAK